MRVNRTFAFLDLCGFTAYTDVHGDAAAVAVLGRLRLAVRGLSERRGVRVTKWLGDGVMLSAVEPDSLVRCASEVIAATNHPLPLRGGVARGEVIMFEGEDYIGAAVNLAARLCHVAPPNHLLVTADLHDTRRSADVPWRRLHVEGFERAVAVVDLPSASAPAEIPSGTSRVNSGDDSHDQPARRRRAETTAAGFRA